MNEPGFPSVLFLSHTAVLGGAELYLLDLASRWKGPKRVVLFADGPLRHRLESADVPVRVLDGGGALRLVSREGGAYAQLRAAPAVACLGYQAAAEAADFDLIFANSQKALVAGALAAEISRRPLVWYLHDIMSAEHFGALNRRFAVMLANRCATRVIANSEASRAAFVQCGGRAERTHVVPNGLEPGRFAPNPETEAAARAIRDEFRQGSGPVLGIFSRLAPWKGQDVLLEALGQLDEGEAWLIGAPLFGGEADYEHQLKKMAWKLGLTDRVRFLGFRDDIPALLQAVDVVLHTSILPEPFGRVIVEGMLAGKPVVASRAGGACEIIEDGTTGWLCAPGDPAALAGRIRHLLRHPEETRAVARRGQEAAVERFSLDVTVARVRDIAGQAVANFPL